MSTGASSITGLESSSSSLKLKRSSKSISTPYSAVGVFGVTIGMPLETALKSVDPMKTSA